MRILQLGPYAPPHGGVQANLAAIRGELLGRGISCAVIAITRSDKAETDEEVYRPANPLSLLRLMMRLRYDIIHLHIGGNVSLRVLALAYACALMPRSKSVLTFHSGGYPSSPAGKTARPATLRGFVFRRLDRIIAVNQEIVEMFERFGVEPQRIRLISPHAVSSPSPETRLPDSFESFRQAHKPLLLTVGGLEEAYDLRTQIEALGLIRERFPQAGLVIVGSGSLEAEIRRQINSKTYAEHILVCGDVAHPVTLRMMAESQLFLRTTLYDGDSIAVREALHIGTPVIATDNAMRPAGVDLVPSSDAAALSQAIEKRLARLRPPGLINHADNENIKAVLDVYQELAQRTAR